MRFIKENFWQMLIAGAILLWVGWVSLGVHHSVSKEKLDKTTDQFTRLVELMVTANKEMVTKKDLRDSIRDVREDFREDMRAVREDMRTIREDMRAGFERIDRRLEALEKRFGKRNNSD